MNPEINIGSASRLINHQEYEFEESKSYKDSGRINQTSRIDDTRLGETRLNDTRLGETILENSKMHSNKAESAKFQIKVDNEEEPFFKFRYDERSEISEAQLKLIEGK